MCIGFDLSLNDLDAVVYHTYLVIMASVKFGDLREGSTLKFGDNNWGWLQFDRSKSAPLQTKKKKKPGVQCID